MIQDFNKITELMNEITKLRQFVESMITPDQNKNYPVYIRELSLVKTKMQEAHMWAALALPLLSAANNKKEAEKGEEKKEDV